MKFLCLTMCASFSPWWPSLANHGFVGVSHLEHPRENAQLPSKASATTETPSISSAMAPDLASSNSCKVSSMENNWAAKCMLLFVLVLVLFGTNFWKGNCMQTNSFLSCLINLFHASKNPLPIQLLPSMSEGYLVSQNSGSKVAQGKGISKLDLGRRYAKEGTQPVVGLYGLNWLCFFVGTRCSAT